MDKTNVGDGTKSANFIIHPKLWEKGIGVHLDYFIISNFDNSNELYDYDSNVIQPQTKAILEKYKLETLKDDPIVAAYRKFYWEHLKIDPTKIRPAGEALIRRLLQGKTLPKINRFVDGYNWASAVSKIPIGAYDFDMINGAVTLRFAEPGESFTAIGGKVRSFKGNELITIDDSGNILSQFPYRDAELTKVTQSTTSILVTCLGIRQIQKRELDEAGGLVVDFLKKCRGDFKKEFNVTEFKYSTNMAYRS